MTQRENRIGWVTTAASFGFALVQLDVTIVNVALPRIASELHANIALLQWVVDAYALSFAVLLLSMGYFGDRFGARKVYLGGLALFAVASLGCGLSPNATLLIAGRAFQGIGAAAMLPNSLALLSHATAHSPAARARAIGWWTAAGSIAIAAGPIIGGLLLGMASWRSIFLVNLPVCAVGALLTLRLPETVCRKHDGGFDRAGQILAILMLAALITAVIEARPQGLASPFVLGCFSLALIVAGLFWRTEARSPHPMLPLRFFKAPGFTAATLYGVVVNLTYYGVVFLLSLYLQTVHGYSAVRTGIAYIPLTATFFAVNIFSGWLVARTGARLPMIFGALIDAAGFALILLLGANSSYWLMLPAFALLPAGMGLGVPAMTNTVLAAVDKESSGVASAVLNAARQAAGAIGVALFGALAGDHKENIVAGLHGSALISIVLLLGAAAIAMSGIRHHPKAIA